MIPHVRARGGGLAARRHRDAGDGRAIAASTAKFNTAYDNPIYDQGGQGRSPGAAPLASNMPRDIMSLQFGTGHNLGSGGGSAL